MDRLEQIAQFMLDQHNSKQNFQNLPETLMPKDFDDYCKSFPHGNTLLEVRSGNTKQSIAPGSAIDGENIDWHEKLVHKTMHFTGKRTKH